VVIAEPAIHPDCGEQPGLHAGAPQVGARCLGQVQQRPRLQVDPCLLVPDLQRLEGWPRTQRKQVHETRDRSLLLTDRLDEVAGGLRIVERCRILVRPDVQRARPVPDQGNVDSSAAQRFGQRGGDALAVVGDRDHPRQRRGRRADRGVDDGGDETGQLGVGDRRVAIAGGRDRRVAVAGGGVHGQECRDEGSQGSGLGQGFHAFFVDRCGGGGVGLQGLCGCGEDFDSFDGVDAQVGFHVDVEAEHFGWVSGPFCYQSHQLAGDLVGAWWLRCGLHRRRYRGGYLGCGGDRYLGYGRGRHLVCGRYR
jgi:hypothetical protein